jgi:ElaB/YqjD/DUF883 family membrane-anchored ribosome-binding protein
MDDPQASSAPAEGTSTRKVIDDLKVLARDAEALLKATAGEVSEKTRDARERLKTALDSARKSCQQLEERAIDGAKAADRVIREHPYPSIGVAFGIGLLLGLLVARK